MTHLTTIALSKIDFNLTSARQRDRVSLLDEGGVSLSKVVVNQNLRGSMFNRVQILIIIGLIFSLFSQAQEMGQQDALRSHRTETYITFRVGSIVADENYDSNGERLSSIITHLQAIIADSTLTINSVEFSGMASPEGRSDINHRLSRQRMGALEHYIRSRVDIPNSIVTYSDLQVAWEYLDSLVLNSDMLYRNEVSHIIQNTPIYIYKNNKIVDGRKKQLMDFNYGRTWHDMDKRFFHAMRNVCAVVVTYEKVTPKTITVEVELPSLKSETTEEPDTTFIQEPLVVEQSIVEPTTKPFYMAVKTNALYDLLAIPNLGLELYLGKKWSVAANWHYAWWKTDSKSWYWRTYGGDIALRRWLGRKAAEKPLTGHHVGVYGQLLTYDFETGGRGYLGDKWSYAAGVEYGYSLPVAKRMNIDFTLGLGYLSGEYKEYLPMDDCYVWQATKNRKWMGPTKAEISLVWLIGHGNKNKGGKR